MKQLTLLILFILPFALMAQDNEYNAASNPEYWKNRKPFPGYWQQDVHYLIRATLVDTSDLIMGDEVLIYTNNSPDTLHELYFHLYQNAFVKGSYLEQLNIRNGYIQKFGKHEAVGEGTIIHELYVNRQKTAFTIDNTIAIVQLSEPIAPGKNAVINIAFSTWFDPSGDQRRRMKTFTDNWGNKQYDGVHWYPRICVYDRKFGWETDQHLGKEFYGDYGQYEVELNLPHHYIVDATGVLQNKDEALPSMLRGRLDLHLYKDKPWDSKPTVLIEPDSTRRTYRTWKFKAINVHDFAWVADPTFRIGETVLRLPNGHLVDIVALAQEPHAKGWQDAASFTSKVIDTYSRDIGNYVYPKMIVADARDGMEYPMLTLDGGFSPNYYGLLAHEVGHNWFFGMVGNNETYRACLDEGFTQFLTHWSMTRLTPEQPTYKGYNKYIQRFSKPLPQVETTVYRGYLADAMEEEDMPLNTHSDDFNSALGHGGGYREVYYKTATMLYNLQYTLGDSLFLVCMKQYFNQWKICHPYPEDFRNSIIHSSHVDLNWFFDEWLETTKKLDYSLVPPSLLSKKDGIFTYQLQINRIGEMQMPLDIAVFTKDGKIHSYHIPNGYFLKQGNYTALPTWKGWGLLNPTYTTSITLNSKIKRVQIDTTYRLPDVMQLDNAWPMPVKLTFDHQLKNAPDRKYYLFKWRPDIWWNALDGIKAGVHLNGSFMNRYDAFQLTVWYNTDLATNYPASSVSRKSNTLLDYNFSFNNSLGKGRSLFFQSRQLDGLSLNLGGYEWTKTRNRTFKLYAKSMIRFNTQQLYYVHGDNTVQSTQPDYFPTTVWNANKLNLTLNLDYERHSTLLKNGSFTYRLFMKGTAFASEYNYWSLKVEEIFTKPISRFDLKVRLMAQAIAGSSIAPESKIYLAGANPEEQMENKYSRSIGVVPSDWSAIGSTTNHFQMGGGANIRGYAGYFAPVNTATNQYYLYNGNAGLAMNTELNFDRFIHLPSRGMLKPFHLDAYLFCDVGYMMDQRKDLTTHDMINLSTDVLASAGPGFMLSIRRWGILEEVKPLNIRFDMPLFLSKTPYDESNSFQFRWVVGINRAF